ncbi:phage tail protein [Enterococcus cecorum]|uniref:phage tail protein n=1 Tax=Enterococcus cecorum TaxID=44008 RepID=UPI00200A8DE8
MENLRIAVRDSTDTNTIAFFDNQSGIPFEANMTEFLSGTTSFLNLKCIYKDIDQIYEGCKLAFINREKEYWLTINEINKVGFECQIKAYSLQLETIKEIRGPFKAPEKWNFEQYLQYIDPERSLLLFENEVYDKRMQLEWTGESTILERLFSIADSFGAELEFKVELNNDYSLQRHIINVYKKGNLGMNSSGMPLRVGKDFELIEYHVNIEELYTGIRCKGKDGLTISGINKKIYDNEGKLLYYSEGNTIYAPQSRDRWPSITHKSSDSFIIYDAPDTQYESKEALFGYMLSELKKHSVPKIEYKISGHIDGRVGDTKTFVDDLHYDPPLIIEGRISEQTIKLTPGADEGNTILINYERKYSQIDESLIKMMEKMAEQKTPYIGNLITSNGNQFLNNAGTTKLTPSVIKGLEQATGLTFDWFKNGVKIATGDTLTVNASDFDRTAVYSYLAYMENQEVAKSEITISKVQDGADGADGIPGKPGADGRTSYAHIAYANSSDGRIDFSVSNSDRKYIGFYTDFNQADSSNPSMYQWSLIKGTDGADGIPGKPGVDGRTPYFHTAYANSSDGSVGFSTTDSTNKFYMGTVTDYNVSDPTDYRVYNWMKVKGDTGATGPQGVPGRDGQNGRDGTNGQNAYLHVAYANSIDGRIDFSITSSSNRVYMGTYTDNIFNQSTDPTKYQWIRVKGDPGIPGKDGKNGIIYSSTEPSNPIAGQLWQAPNQPLKRYTGVSWVIHQFYADNVAAENLTVENGKFTKLVGTSIESGEFISSFKNVLVPWSRSYSSGRTILKDGNLYSEGTIDNLYPFKSEYTPVGMSSTVYQQDGETPRMTVSTTYGGIYLYDHEQDIGGTLSVDMLYDTGWVDLPLLKGTGNIRVRRYMKRYMLWFDNFVWNGSDNRNPVVILPEEFRTGRNQMLYAAKWSLNYNDSEKFQMNADGSIHKISNVSTWGLAGFVEYF